MGFYKFGLVIAVFIGYVSAKGYNIGTRPGGNVPTQQGSRPGFGGGMQSKIGGVNPEDSAQYKIGAGGQLPSNRGGGIPSQLGTNYGPIGQTPIDVGSHIGGGVPSITGGRVPSNIGGLQSNLGGQLPSNRGSSQLGNNYGPIGQRPIDVGSPIGGGVPSVTGGRVPSNIQGRPEYGNNRRQVPNREETYPPRPFNVDYNIVDEQGNVQFKQEEGDGAGNVRGVYGYRDTQGLYRTVEYTSSRDGFKATVNTNEPGTDGKINPADVIMNVEQTPAGIQEQYNSGRNGNQGQNIYQGGRPNIGVGVGPSTDGIRNYGVPGDRRGPMTVTKTNRGLPDLPAGVNPGGQPNTYNLGAGVGPITGGIRTSGVPGDRRGPMAAMKPNKGSPDLPAGVNPGGRRNPNAPVGKSPLNTPQNYAHQSPISVY